MLLKQMDLKHGGVILTSFVSKVFEVCESSGHFWKRGNAADAIDASERLIPKRAPRRACTD